MPHFKILLHKNELNSWTFSCEIVINEREFSSVHLNTFLRQHSVK